ncbi:DUF3023 domain-containing protein [Ehrlichia ruminantium]|uniref:DUF3023 domain-containing protein n=1 Tax=Ehrlichia ruminantium TaxID=779 RepID=UPI00130DA33F|nr:DUF3023 domain-containing protein [Ehrlichia ruminantium]QGR02484.1 DUF3023 domain-containing protein [Ehrlichia ruminantium]
MPHNKIVKIVNKTLCSKIDLLTDVRIRRCYCIGNTVNSDKSLRVYIDKTHKNKQPPILPDGQSLFLLTLAVPTDILKNDYHLRRAFLLSNEESQRKYINVKVCFLIDGKNLESFRCNVLSLQKPACNYLVKYGTSLFARPLINCFHTYKCDEYYCLVRVIGLQADFIIDESEKEKLYLYGKKYCYKIFSHMHNKSFDRNVLSAIQEDSGTEEEQPVKELVETCVESLSLGKNV